MTDRVYALSVVLTEDIRTDEIDGIINAIKMVRGVLSVGENISDISQWTAEERARSVLASRLWDVLYPKKAT